MPDSSDEVKRPRGRPRSKQAEQAVLEATHELLVEQGLQQTTIEAIAAKSGVSKATIYKWWPNRAAVIMSAFLHLSLSRIPYPPNLISREVIIDRLKNMGREFCGPVGSMMAALIAECQADPGFAEAFRRGYIDARRKEGVAVVKAAMKAGLLRKTDPHVLLDTIYGPLYYRLLVGHQPLSDKFVTSYLELIFDGIFVDKA